MQLQLYTETTQSEVCQTENLKEGISSTTISDITSASNSDNVLLHRQEFRLSGYQPPAGSSSPSGGCGRTGGVQQFLSIGQ